MAVFYGFIISIALFISGLVILFGKYPFVIRGTHLSIGWLLVVFGVLRLIWAYYTYRKTIEARNRDLK